MFPVARASVADSDSSRFRKKCTTEKNNKEILCYEEQDVLSGKQEASSGVWKFFMEVLH
jgi:hypothetical protein